jgi:hypothetical protein
MGGTAPDFSGFQYSGPPAPDPNQPADFSSFGPPITSTNTGSFASGAAPATFTGVPPAGTQELENQIGPAQQNLGNALQNQQAPRANPDKGKPQTSKTLSGR